jgi:nucleotide-binding universal stress UspA family protein
VALVAGKKFMPLPKQILVPIDFSETAAAALDYSKTLAAAVGAALHVLHVMDDPLLGFKLPDHVCSIPIIRKLMEQEASEHMSKVLTADEQKKFRAELITVWGSPYVKVIEYAKEHEIDLIVMGTHGRGIIGHLLLGNVAERVIRHASCPVLVVRPPQDAGRS